MSFVHCGYEVSGLNGAVLIAFGETHPGEATVQLVPFDNCGLSVLIASPEYCQLTVPSGTGTVQAAPFVQPLAAVGVHIEYILY
jgi:hypothetical protein